MSGSRAQLGRGDAAAAAPSPGASDAELVAMSREGSRAAFGVLVERHQGHVLALLRRRVRPAADAEDLAQEAFVRAWESLERFDSARCFRTWVHTIASRLAIDHLRSRSAAARREGIVGRERERPNGVEAGEEGEGGLPAVWAMAREVLDDTPFTALWLRYVEGLETNQIARVLGKNRVAVSMILCRARAKLAARIGGAERTEARGVDAKMTNQMRPDERDGSGVRVKAAVATPGVRP